MLPVATGVLCRSGPVATVDCTCVWRDVPAARRQLWGALLFVACGNCVVRGVDPLFVACGNWCVTSQ